MNSGMKLMVVSTAVLTILLLASLLMSGGMMGGGMMNGMLLFWGPIIVLVVALVVWVVKQAHRR